MGMEQREQPVIQQETQPMDEPDTFVLAPDTLIDPDTIQSEEIVEAPQPEPAPTPFDINNMRHITFEPGKFYVIHGSLASDADCAKHVRQACLQKYNPSILVTPGDWHRRVCLGVFTSESEAERFASNIHKAWVKSE